jgi:hypothetical protein
LQRRRKGVVWKHTRSENPVCLNGIPVSRDSGENIMQDPQMRKRSLLNHILLIFIIIDRNPRWQRHFAVFWILDRYGTESFVFREIFVRISEKIIESIEKNIFLYMDEFIFCRWVVLCRTEEKNYFCDWHIMQGLI